MFEGLFQPMHCCSCSGLPCWYSNARYAGVRQRNWRRNPRIQIGDEGTCVLFVVRGQEL
jgi:hypothetical protein